MKAPRIPTIFKIGSSEPRGFKYKPRIYDEEKEKFEKRKRQIEKELDLKKQGGLSHEEDLRERISNSWSRREMRSKDRGRSRRLIIILIALALICYLIYTKLDLIL